MAELEQVYAWAKSGVYTCWRCKHGASYGGSPKGYYDGVPDVCRECRFCSMQTGGKRDNWTPAWVK